MAFSAQVVAGVAVGCAVACSIITVPVVLWIRRRLAANRRPKVDPFQWEKDIFTSTRAMKNLLGTHMFDSEWDAGVHLWTLYIKVSSYVRNYLGGPGTDPDFPYDSSKLHQLAGGPYEDWDRLTEVDRRHRESSLVHFICRVLYLRMIPDGDVNITILPTDMLSTYQRILTKIPPRPPRGHTFDDEMRLSLVMRQYWRALTVYWSSQKYAQLYVDLNNDKMTRPNCWAVDWYSNSSRTDGRMLEDDPRMPSILKVEALLKDALSPFFPAPTSYDPEDAHKRLDSIDAQHRLRLITECAADLAIKAFGETKPMEFYWPETNRREGPTPVAWGGLLECFGIRQRSITPGCERSEKGEAAATIFEMEPIYNDTHENKVMVRHTLPERTRAMHERREEGTARGEEETEDERKKRESLDKDYAAAKGNYDRRLKPNVEYPGWVGTTYY